MLDGTRYVRVEGYTAVTLPRHSSRKRREPYSISARSLPNTIRIAIRQLQRGKTSSVSSGVSDMRVSLFPNHSRWWVVLSSSPSFLLRMSSSFTTTASLSVYVLTLSLSPASTILSWKNEMRGQEKKSEGTLAGLVVPLRDPLFFFFRWGRGWLAGGSIALGNRRKWPSARGSPVDLSLLSTRTDYIHSWKKKKKQEE